VESCCCGCCPEDPAITPLCCKMAPCLSTRPEGYVLFVPGYFFELGNHFFYVLGVKILKYFGMETVRILDPGWKKVGSGINTSRIRTLFFWFAFVSWNLEF